MSPSKKQHQNHNLLSKTDIAKALGMTSQTFSNRQTRDDKFPPPTYSNRSGSVALYTPEDAKKVYDYCTRAERERLQRAEQMFASLTGTEDEASFENVELFTDEDEGEGEAEDVKEEAPAAAPAAKPEAKTEVKAEVKTEAAAPTAAEKEAKQKATAEKIKAADAKIAADKAEAARKAAEASRLDKNEARRIAAADNKSGIAPATKAESAKAVPAAPATPPAAAKAPGTAFIKG